MDGTVPTLAEYLGSRGYATAGFVGNTIDCSYENGLDRGFTHFEDYVLEYLMPFRTAWLVDHVVGIAGRPRACIVGRDVRRRPVAAAPRVLARALRRCSERKDAGSINRAFLDWLSHASPARAAVLRLPQLLRCPRALRAAPRGRYRFGLRPRQAGRFHLPHGVLGVGRQDDIAAGRLLELAEDSYDNCVAYLDEQLGELIRELLRRGVLEHTLVIVTADHGEGMGEHDLFDHGESLYRAEIHVPLLIVPPAGQRARGSCARR